ncbi:AraC family transcriptional regulator [Sphaerotilus mobilis]|uniref:AraC family transcriptional regulator n=1 Tax=Sphaerotilus mobilis TaxID=47994 RepID=A0A4Q7LR41_9BURK|nr:AraC family transcriptional regulator [Sphaerotilus mobilis]RZS56632.1 AraC family transcriptional regulator [Sphaerotilus mobilis]
MSDRLSALLQRFELHARVFHSGALCGITDFDGGAGIGHLHLLRRGPLGVTDTLGRHRVVSEPSVLFFPRAGAYRLDGGEGEGADVVCASIDFGAGDENPLLLGLPALLSVPLAQLPGLDLAQQLLFGEAQAGRCGHGAVVDRLTEVLVIQLLRHAMAHQLVDGGVMAGLADPRLAKAISALHADPARPWTLEVMAEQAGMSRARFAAHFTRTVGVPPGEYLTGWRLGLARSLLRQGLPVKQVAADVGYVSPGAFGRVFLQRLGMTPSQWQLRASPRPGQTGPAARGRARQHLHGSPASAPSLAIKPLG